MGMSSFPLGLLKISCIRLSVCRNIRVLQMDGKALKFKAPLLVKDLLANFEGIVVRSLKKAFNNLPSDFKLKLGRVYYHLLPSKAVHQAAKPEAAGNKAEAAKSASSRIKVMVTKKQLHELLTNKTSIEQVLCEIDKSSPTYWKPILTSIPEEDEPGLVQE